MRPRQEIYCSIGPHWMASNRPEETMKGTLQAGLTASKRIAVDKPRTIDFLGENLRAAAKAAA